MRSLPLLSALLTLGLSSLGGCVIYGKDLIFSDDCGPDGPCDEDGWHGDDTAAAEDPAEAETVWALSPNTLDAGETRILSLSADPVFDYGLVDEIELYGDAAIDTFEIHDAEIQLVVTAAQGAPTGTADLLLLTVDGDGIWLEDALNIGLVEGAEDEDAAGDEGTGDEGAGSDDPDCG